MDVAAVLGGAVWAAVMIGGAIVVTGVYGLGLHAGRRTRGWRRVQAYALALLISGALAAITFRAPDGATSASSTLAQQTTWGVGVLLTLAIPALFGLVVGGQEASGWARARGPAPPESAA